jgi:hypothetical protein
MKKLLFITIAVMFSAAACNIKQQAQVQPLQNQQAQNSQQQQPADEADWSTYTNSAVGFSFQYPINWFVKNNLTSKTCCLDITNSQTVSDNLLSGQIKIQVQKYVKSASQPLEAFASVPNELTGKIPKVEQLIIAGVNGVKSDAIGEGIYYLPKSSTEGLSIIIFSNPSNKSELQATYQQIISTFKFINAKDPIVGQTCGGGAMANGGACPVGYMCKIDKQGPPAEGTCVKQ